LTMANSFRLCSQRYSNPGSQTVRCVRPIPAKSQVCVCPAPVPTRISPAVLHGVAERFGLVPVIEAAHKVVRIAVQPALPAIASAHFTLKPEVEHIVQIHVGQHGETMPPWGVPLSGARCVRLLEDARRSHLRTSRMKVHRGFFVQHPHQPIVPEVVEEPFDVSFIDNSKPPRYSVSVSSRTARAVSVPLDSRSCTAGSPPQISPRGFARPQAAPACPPARNAQRPQLPVALGMYCDAPARR